MLGQYWDVWIDQGKDQTDAFAPADVYQGRGIVRRGRARDDVKAIYDVRGRRERIDVHGHNVAGQVQRLVGLAKGSDPEDIVEAKGLAQISDAAALETILDQVMADNPDKAAACRSGKTGLAGFFIGQVIRATGGKANPQVVNALVENRLIRET